MMSVAAGPVADQGHDVDHGWDLVVVQEAVCVE